MFDICSQTFLWETIMDRKLRKNCKLIANDMNKLYLLMDG